ncbi:MAG: CoA ester lyase [Rudaea sp.]|uniref:HpcH/HpaI aldolase/citrate lyase family protein n=1 Tax=Rudaea sp. TaxID=2136325 RepID=UPI0039E600C1
MKMPLLRSKLFVPGTRPELFAKAFGGTADAISFDLEDAVPEDAKARARAQVAEFVRDTDMQGSGKRVIVRVNALDSPHFVADVEAFAGLDVDLINLPKCESAQAVIAAAAVLERVEAAAHRAAPVGLLVNVETPKALRLAVSIATAHPRVKGLQLGLGDLFEPFGIDRRDPRNVHAAMFALRMAAAEAGVFCCDAAFAEIDDEEGYRAEAHMARQLGFVGKTCIHPKQVALANAAFTAGPQEIERARRIVAAARLAAKSDCGAVLVDGSMIDAPYLRRAEAIIAAADDIPPKMK